MTVPRVIHSAWLQGAAQAPAIVQLCFSRWTRLNPEYQLRVLQASDASTLLGGHAFPALPAQALSDIMRVKLLLEHGGIWADATLFPVFPLRDWLPGMMARGDFFAFARPGPDRPLASWFLAAPPGHTLMVKLWREILRFWSRARRPVMFGDSIIPPDPAGSVSPAGDPDIYPYFWLHYLFQYLLDSDADFAAAWALCAQPSADAPHLLQTMFVNAAPLEAMTGAARAAPVQKLNWRDAYPIEILAQV
jgi:hypothetical protein